MVFFKGVAPVRSYILHCMSTLLNVYRQHQWDRVGLRKMRGKKLSGCEIGVDLGGTREVDEKDQNTMNEIIKELIKIFFKL